MPSAVRLRASLSASFDIRLRALRAQTSCALLGGTPPKSDLIEQVASDAYDTEGPFDDHGRVLVTPEAETGSRRLVLKPFQGTDPRIGIV